MASFRACVKDLEFWELSSVRLSPSTSGKLARNLEHRF